MSTNPYNKKPDVCVGARVTTNDGLAGVIVHIDAHLRWVVKCDGDNKERAYHPSNVRPEGGIDRTA